MSAAAPTVLAVCGLHAEARIAAEPGIAVLAGGGDAARLAQMLEVSLSNGAKAVISFGIAGGLSPEMRPGSVIVADTVGDADTTWSTDTPWSMQLRAALPQAHRGHLVGVDQAVASPDRKADLHRRSGALAVDMESHIAARLAAQHHVPFAAVRVVADPAIRALPEAALVGMRADGSTDVAAVLRALAKRPGDVPALIRTALDARAAFAALRQSRDALGLMFGFYDDGISVANEPRIGGETSRPRASRKVLTEET